jgi:hypothetical protein
METKRSQLEETLKQVGFRVHQSNHDRLDLDIIPPKPVPKGSFGFPWLVKQWSLIRHKGAWYTDRFEIQLNRPFFQMGLNHFIRLQLPQTMILDLEEDAAGLWVVIEFKSPTGEASKTEKSAKPAYQRGVFGFHCSLLVETNKVSLNFSNHFAFGAIDRQVLEKLPDCVGQAIGLAPANWKRSFFEISADLHTWILAAESLKQHRQVFAKLLARPSPRRELKVAFEKNSGWRVFLSSPDLTEFGFVLPPIEVLESRELAERFKHIEQAAAQGQFDRVRQDLIKGLEEFPESLYLLRRLALIGLMDDKPLADHLIQAMLNVESQNQLFLSAALRAYLAKQDPERMLECVSKIGEILAGKMERFEDLKALEYVMPELLGDGWYQLDEQRAYLCYERILETRGDQLPILQKMIELARQRDDVASEVAMVKRMLKLIKDRGQLASQFLRLAELLESRDLSEAVSYAMKSWQMSPGRFSTAEYVGELLLRDRKPEKAIRVLDETIRHLHKQNAKAKIAELEAMVGQIWWEQLNRKDLASERLKRSYQFSSQNIKSMCRLIEIYRSMGDRATEIAMTEEIYRLAIQQQNREQVFKSVAILIPYFQKEQPNVAKLSNIYQTLVKYYLLKPEEIFDLISQENIQIDWQQLFQSVERQIKSESGLDHRPYYVILGRLARMKLDDRGLAAEYYEKAIHLGHVDETVFQFLEEYYSGRKDHRNLVRILKLQLKDAVGSRRLDLLRQLFYTSDALDGPEIDYYAVCLYFEANDDGPLKRRFTLYQAENQLPAINRLFMELIEEIGEGHQKLEWLEYVLEILHDCESGGRFELINKYLEMLEALHEDEVAVYEQGVRLNENNPDSRPLAHYLDRLLVKGIPPAIDPEIVLRALTDEQASKGLYLLHLAHQQDQEMSRYQNLQKAMTILKSFEPYQATVIDIYTEISDICDLKVAELREFYQLARDLDRLSDFTQSVINQLQRLPAGMLDLDFFNFMVTFLKDHRYQINTIVPLLIESIGQLDSSLRERLKLELFKSLPDHTHFFSYEFGFGFLGQEKNWDLSSNFKSVFRWLINDSANFKKLNDLAMNMLDEWRSEQNQRKVARMVEFLQEYNISSKESQQTAFEYYVAHGMEQKARMHWYHLVAQAKTKEDLRDLIAETKFLLNGLNTTTKVEDFIAQMIDEKYEEALSEEILVELRMEYALSLFMSEKHPEVCHEILSQHFRKHPDDHRVWIPLFFMQSTMENHFELYDLLRYVLPKLNENQELLRSYPVTLESLETEYQTVAKKLNLPDDLPYQRDQQENDKQLLSETERHLQAQAAPRENTSFRLNVDAEAGAGATQSQLPDEETQAEPSYYEPSYLSVAGEPHVGDQGATVPPPPPPAEAKPPLRSVGLSYTDTASTQQTASSINWRLIGASLLAEDGATQSILGQDSLGITEKHLAVQLVALVEGRLDLLETWEYKVWREVEDYFYQPDQRPQSAGLKLRSLKQPLGVALQAFYKVVDSAFFKRLTLRGLADYLDIRIDEFLGQRQHIPFTDTLLSTSAMQFYQSQWSQLGYRIFHYPYLNEAVYFEFQQKVFYIDVEYYRQRPAHFLFHALVRAKKAVDQGFYRTLALSAENDILPAMQAIRELAGDRSKSLANLEIAGVQPFAVASRDDFDQGFGSLAELEDITLEDIKNVMDDLQTQVMLDCLYEHLDLIGLMEQEFNSVYTEWKDDRERMIRSRVVRNLLIHASKFSFED